MGFPVLPVLHLDNGRLLDPPPGADASAGRVLTELNRAYGEVYIIDVQGVRRNVADLAFLAQASKGRVLWMDAGSRYATDAMDLMVAGAGRATLRWNTLQSPKELEELAELLSPDSMYVGLEWNQAGDFLQHPREPAPADAVLRRVADHHMGVVLTAPAYRRDLALLGATHQGEKWWLGPITKDNAQDLAELGYAGALAPAALTAGVAGE